MKKLNKFFAVLVALAMMATLCVSMAFAEDPEPEVYFTKTWSTNEGTKTPAKTFKFKIEQDLTEGVANKVDLSASNIEFAENTTGTKTSNDILSAGKTQGWKDATNKVVPGVYVYTVSEDEVPTTNPEITSETDSTTGAKTTKTTTYSTKQYKLKVWVNKDGKVTGAAVYEGSSKKDSSKPTDGEENQFNFLNTYSEKVETTPTGSDPTKDPEGNKDGATAYVQKTIQATEADQIDVDKEFDFSTTVTFPAIDSEEAYNAQVIDKDGNKLKDVVFTKPDEANAEGKYVDTQTYKLRHGDRLVFEKIDVGAKYTATETGTYDGYEKQTGGEILDTAPETVTTETNGATIVNKFTKGGTPDSGILISNLPYIALALVAIGGLVAYVVVRRRQSDEA